MTRNAEVLLFSVRSGRLQQLKDWLASGFKFVEYEGSLDDPFIRCKKIALRIETFGSHCSWQKSALFDGFDVLGFVKAQGASAVKLPANLDDVFVTHELTPVFSPSGQILKVVLTRKGKQNVGRSLENVL